MTSGRAYTPKQITVLKSAMVEWLTESRKGTFTQACAIVGISRRLGYQWLDADPEWHNLIEIAREKALENGIDFIESQLMQLVAEKNVASVIFALKCLGRKRGWIEKQDIAIDPQNPLTVNHVHRATEDFRQLLTTIAENKTGSGVLQITLDQPSSTEPANAVG